MNKISTRTGVTVAVVAAAVAAIGFGAAKLSTREAAPNMPAARNAPDAQQTAAGRAQAAPGPAPPAAAQIPVILPNRQSVTDYFEITGNAAVFNSVKLLARVEGYLDKIHREDGQFVKKGDLLFTLQQAPYKQQLDQARAMVAVQQAALAHAKTEFVRYSALVKQSAATQIELDRWDFERQSAAAQLASAQAQASIAEVNLGYTEIRAPFDGILGKHLVDPGNVVGGTQPAALAEITQLDPIYVVANVGEQTVLKIRQNLNQKRMTMADLIKVPVEVALQDEQAFSHRGTIEYVAPALDPTTGTVLVRGILPNADRALLPGVFVRIRLPMAKVDANALLVPDRALQTDQGGTYLLIVDKNDVVQQRYVQLGAVVGALRVIASGLGPEDQVVAGEIWRATPGSKVIPAPTPIEKLIGSADRGSAQ